MVSFKIETKKIRCSSLDRHAQKYALKEYDETIKFTRVGMHSVTNRSENEHEEGKRIGHRLMVNSIKLWFPIPLD